MKKNSYLSKILFFIVMVTALLCIVGSAMADECAPGEHDLYDVITKPPKCNEEGKAVTKCRKCDYVSAERTVSLLPHSYEWVTNVQPSCTSKGQKHQVCKVCGTFGEVADVDALGHNMGSPVTVQPPTCTESGISRKTCLRNCGYFVDETIKPLGHDYGAWFVTTQPTCTEAGVETQVCSRNSSHTNTRPVGALGHDYGAWTVTTKPTCTESGEETQVCSRNSSHKNTRPVEPLGHLWGSPVTKPATCIAPATTTTTCQRDSSHKDTSTSGSVDLVNGHVWGDWKVTKKPNCTEEGVETRICKLDSSHIQTRPLAVVPSAHVWDNGTVIKEPTYTEEGEKLFVCTLNPDHTKTVKLDTRPWNNNTVCAFGPRLSETNLYPYNTDAWYMFTPFDASNNGTQTFELVASNTYIVGKVTLTIRDGSLKIDYTLADNSKFDITLEFFTVLNRINDLTQYEPEQLMDLRIGKGETINLEEKFGDDTSLVLYFCSRCNYRFSKKYTLLAYNSAVHQRMLDDMRKLMD